MCTNNCVGLDFWLVVASFLAGEDPAELCVWFSVDQLPEKKRPQLWEPDPAECLWSTVTPPLGGERDPAGVLSAVDQFPEKLDPAGWVSTVDRFPQEPAPAGWVPVVYRFPEEPAPAGWLSVVDCFSEETVPAG